MKHTVDSLMALADAYAEISIGSTTAHAVEMQEALRAALAEALKERDALKLDAERLNHLEKNGAAMTLDWNRRSKWSYRPTFTSYEYDCFLTAREAIDAAMKGAA